MRLLYPIVMVLLAATWFASISESGVSYCNQEMYDNVYRSILNKALSSKLSEKDVNDRNDTIENLRKLCNGQKSSFENLNNYDTKRNK